MTRRKGDRWTRLLSGFYVPPLLSFAPGYPCCCEGRMRCLDVCANDRGPEEYQADIDGWGPGTCGDCAELNGSFVALAVPGQVVSPGSYFPWDVTTACTWSDSDNPHPCHGTMYVLPFIWFDSVSGNYGAAVRQLNRTGNPDIDIWWKKNLTTHPTKPDCRNINALALDFFSSAAAGRCDDTAPPTCILTAL